MGLILGIITGALLLACAVVAVWMAGAIYYDVCGGARWGRWVALGWVVGVVAMFAAWQPLWQPFVALLGAESLFLVWWLRQKPSHDRDWDPSVAVLPRAVIATGTRSRSRTSATSNIVRWTISRRGTKPARITSRICKRRGHHFLQLGDRR